MDFKSMETGAILERRSAIGLEIEKDDADLVALDEELRAIDAELETRKAAETKKAALRKAVADGAGIAVEEKEGEEMDVKEVRSTQAYIDAFADYIKSGEDKEVRALLSSNVSGGQVPVPTIVEDRIRTAWEKSAVMALVKKTNLKGNVKVGFELSATGAVVHTEGSAAPAEETLTLGVVTMTPQSIKKWITVSDEALDLTSEAFLLYIYDELAYRIAKKAEEILIGLITAAPAAATATAVSVTKVTTAPVIGAIAHAMAAVTSEATNLTVVLNRSTWAEFKAAQYGANFALDIFEGLNVEFTDALPAYSAATNGQAYAIVGDFGLGAQANFPSGEEITIKIDELSLAEKDLVKFVGREFVGLGLVNDKAFATLVKPASV